MHGCGSGSLRDGRRRGRLSLNAIFRDTEKSALPTEGLVAEFLSAPQRLSVPRNRSNTPQLANSEFTRSSSSS